MRPICRPIFMGWGKSEIRPPPGITSICGLPEHAVQPGTWSTIDAGDRRRRRSPESAVRTIWFERAAAISSRFAREMARSVSTSAAKTRCYSNVQSPDRICTSSANPIILKICCDLSLDDSASSNLYLVPTAFFLTPIRSSFEHLRAYLLDRSCSRTIRSVCCSNLHSDAGVSS